MVTALHTIITFRFNIHISTCGIVVLQWDIVVGVGGYKKNGAAIQFRHRLVVYQAMITITVCDHTGGPTSLVVITCPRQYNLLPGASAV